MVSVVDGVGDCRVVVWCSWLMVLVIVGGRARGVCGACCWSLWVVVLCLWLMVLVIVGGRVVIVVLVIVGWSCGVCGGWLW